MQGLGCPGLRPCPVWLSRSRCCGRPTTRSRARSGCARSLDTHGRRGQVSELKPQLLLLSALLATTMLAQRETIEALKAAGLRGEVKVMVGGAPVTQEWADEIGVDGFADDAIEAVAVAKKLVSAG